MEKKYWMKIGKGASIAAGAAILTYITKELKWVQKPEDLPALTALLAIAINAVKVWLVALAENASNDNQ